MEEKKDEPKSESIIIDLTTVDEDQDMKDTDKDTDNEDDRHPWWVRINGTDFGYKSNIPLKHHCKVKEYDILIHKKVISGEKFPRINYFIIIFDNNRKILDGKPSTSTNKTIKSFMIDFLIDYIKKYNKLPYACTVEEIFKNGNVKVLYNPNKWDHFPLDVTVKRGIKYDIPNLEEFFTGLPTTEKNPASSGGGNKIRRRK